MSAMQPEIAGASSDVSSANKHPRSAPANRTAGGAAAYSPRAVAAARHRSPEAGHASPSTSQRLPDVRRLLGLSVPLTIVLAERLMPVEAILEITLGTIIEFETLFDSELSLQVANRTIGRGQAVKVGENFGLRITAIESVAQRIGALGGQ